MMTVNHGTGTGSSAQGAGYAMNGQTDSFTKSIRNQIAEARKQMQELSADKNTTPEDKMRKKQEIQQEIANLNQQLRQHQIEQRKERQPQNASAKEKPKDSRKAAAAKQGTGFSQAGMAAMLSADSSIKQAKVLGSAATKMEGRASVLKTEIKLDGNRGGDTSAKETELAEATRKAEAATNFQLNTLAEANQAMAEASETGKADEAARPDNGGKTDDGRKSEHEDGRTGRAGQTNVTDKISGKTEETTGMGSAAQQPTASGKAANAPGEVSLEAPGEGKPGVFGEAVGKGTYFAARRHIDTCL